MFSFGVDKEMAYNEYNVIIPYKFVFNSTDPNSFVDRANVREILMAVTKYSNSLESFDQASDDCLNNKYSIKFILEAKRAKKSADKAFKYLQDTKMRTGIYPYFI